MDVDYKLVGGGAALVVGGYFLVDYLMKRNEPGQAGVSAGERLLGVVASNTVARLDGTCTVPTFKTWYPMIQGSNAVISNVENHSLYGVAALGDNYFGQGCGKMIALMASLETMDGNLRCKCFNCNLFNIHGSCNPGFVNYVGTDRNRSFTANSGVASIEAFNECLASFKRILERNANYMDALRSGNPDEFQRLMATVNYDGSRTGTYTSSVNGNVIVNPFFRRRYERLRAGNIIP